MFKKNIAILLAVLCIVFLIVGCSSSSDDSSGDENTEIKLTEIGQIESAEEFEKLQLNSLSVGGFVMDSTDGIGDDEAEAAKLSTLKSYIWDNLKKYFGKYAPAFFKMTYYTTDSKGNKQKVTGLVVIPVPFGKTQSHPILSMQHPTQVERKYSPSAMNTYDNEFTSMLAGIISMTGYIVVVPDYPGLGDNYDVHPYCHKSLSNSVVDMIGAAINSQSKFEGLGVKWNGKVVLMGYSEGGYATMVAAQALQESGKYPIDAAAPLDGPYSLSVTMKNIMLTAGTSYDAPYFLPYFVAAYDDIYTPNIVFTEAVKSSVPDYDPPEGKTYATVLYSYLDGSHTPTEIIEFMKKATPYEGPKSILQTPFLEKLSDNSSYVSQKLDENNGYADWAPTIPIKMFHNTKDDYVPHDNLVQAQKNFPDRSNIEYESFDEYVQIDSSMHVNAFPVAMVKGFIYVDKYGHPERHKKKD